MALFVHLTAEKNARQVRRSGIKPSKRYGDRLNGVFAMAVMPNFTISHQWLRELKAFGQRTICGVYFRVPDDELVYVGHYNAKHQAMTASLSLGLILKQEDAQGYEIIIPRKVRPAEIHKIRRLPQDVGWRYYPEVRQRAYCACPICVRPGTVRSKIKNRKWEAEQA